MEMRKCGFEAQMLVLSCGYALSSVKYRVILDYLLENFEFIVKNGYININS